MMLCGRECKRMPGVALAVIGADFGKFECSASQLLPFPSAISVLFGHSHLTHRAFIFVDVAMTGII